MEHQMRYNLLIILLVFLANSFLANCQEEKFTIPFEFDSYTNLNAFILDISDDLSHYLGTWGYEGGDHSFDLIIQHNSGKIIVRSILQTPYTKDVNIHKNCKIIGCMLLCDEIKGLFIYLPDTQEYAFYQMENCVGNGEEFNPCGYIYGKYRWFDLKNNKYILKEIEINSEAEYKTVRRNFKSQGFSEVKEFFQMKPGKYRLVAYYDEENVLRHKIQYFELIKK